MMRSLFCLLFLCCSHILFAQGYLLTKQKDSIAIHHPIEVDQKSSWKWTQIRYDSVTYALDDIEALYLDGTYYRVIQGQLWQRVIQGKINVFVRSAKDTLSYRRGSFMQPVYMQQGDTGLFKKLTYQNLSRLYPGLSGRTERAYVGKQTGKITLVVLGIGTSAAGALVTLAGTAEQLFSRGSSSGKNLILGGISTMGLGAGLISTGASIQLTKKEIKPSILHEVRRINAKGNP